MNRSNSKLLHQLEVTEQSNLYVAPLRWTRLCNTYGSSLYPTHTTWRNTTELFAIGSRLVDTTGLAGLWVLLCLHFGISSETATMNIAHSIPSTVSSISFSFLTTEDIKRISVKQIVNPVLLDDLNRPNIGGLYDPALGPSDKQDM